MMRVKQSILSKPVLLSVTVLWLLLIVGSVWGHFFAQDEQDELKVGSTMTSRVDGMVQVYVPEGEFLMGSVAQDEGAYSNEKPQHSVYLDAFWIDQTEVTNAHFAAFLNEEGNHDEGGVTWLEIESSSVLIEQENGSFQPKEGVADHPVIEVSWFGAAAYCEWAGRRLPTEAEWEKAARGTDGRTYPWGEKEVAGAGELANFCDANCWLEWSYRLTDDGYASTAPVGSYPAGASPYRALDMAGNVWEWVADWYDDDYYDDYYDDDQQSPKRNPTGPQEASRNERTLRGGAWITVPSTLRTAYRLWGVPTERYDATGFRCARSG